MESTTFSRANCSEAFRLFIDAFGLGEESWRIIDGRKVFDIDKARAIAAGQFVRTNDQRRSYLFLTKEIDKYFAD